MSWQFQFWYVGYITYDSPCSCINLMHMILYSLNLLFCTLSVKVCTVYQNLYEDGDQKGYILLKNDQAQRNK
jgi:hypothetical protein